MKISTQLLARGGREAELRPDELVPDRSMVLDLTFDSKGADIIEKLSV
jgi:hypothetical protein